MTENEEDKRELIEAAAGQPGGDDPLDPADDRALVGRMAAFFRRPSVRRRLLTPIGFDATVLLTNLITGVIVARALGPNGRGELAATLLIAQLAAWIFGIGGSEAISYHRSRHPEDSTRLISSWLAAAVPLSLLGIGVTELVLPTLFGAQTSTAIDLARIYLATIPIVIVQGIFTGVLLGDESFRFFNISRLIPPAIAAISYGALWATGAFSVGLAATVNAVGALAALVLVGTVVLRRYGLARPDWPLLRTSAWYGIRAHAGSAASLVNARLDLLIIPAFLSAASVGLYSVASNVSSILTVLTGTVALIVLPVAARRQGSARTVILTMQAAMAVAITLAIPLLIASPFLLGLVYGKDFEAASTALRILLPGAIMQAGAEVLWSGLLAANKPFLSSLAIVPAAAVTIVGLIVFLPIGGTTAAAIITSTAYVLEFAAMAYFYKRTLKIGWRSFIRAPAT